MGINLTNLLSWCRLTNGKPLPPFWQAFGETHTDSSHFYVLDYFLKEAQCTNLHIQYTIWPDFVHDLKTHKFHYTLTVNNIH